MQEYYSHLTDIFNNKMFALLQFKKIFFYGARYFVVLIMYMLRLALNQ